MILEGCGLLSDSGYAISDSESATVSSVPCLTSNFRWSRWPIIDGIKAEAESALSLREEAEGWADLSISPTTVARWFVNHLEFIKKIRRTDSNRRPGG